MQACGSEVEVDAELEEVIREDVVVIPVDCQGEVGECTGPSALASACEVAFEGSSACVLLRDLVAVVRPTAGQ